MQRGKCNMNKSVFEMIWNTISSDTGIMCAVRAWLWTSIIVMVTCIPVVIRESIKAIVETKKYKDYLKECATNEQSKSNKE